MTGTILQFIKHDGSHYRIMSIDQSPKRVIDAIRNDIPQFIKDEINKGSIEYIDVLETEITADKLPTGKGLRIEKIKVSDLDSINI